MLGPKCSITPGISMMDEFQWFFLFKVTYKNVIIIILEYSSVKVINR